MIEKVKGNINAAKLRAIFLLEVDFNIINKMICNSRVLPRLEVYRVIHDEVIGGRRG